MKSLPWVLEPSMSIFNTWEFQNQIHNCHSHSQIISSCSVINYWYSVICQWKIPPYQIPHLILSISSLIYQRPGSKITIYCIFKLVFPLALFHGSQMCSWLSIIQLLTYRKPIILMVFYKIMLKLTLYFAIWNKDKDFIPLSGQKDSYLSTIY